MKIQRFKKSLTQTNAEKNFLGGVLGVMVLTIAILSIQLMSEDTKVVIKPYTLTEEAWITQDMASEEYQEAMALFFAELLGNVTPATVDFIKQRIDPMLSASIRQDVINALSDQAQTIKTEQVAISFAPRSVVYERPSGKVFVTGRSKTEGPSGGTSEEQRTFEFKFTTKDYLPLLTSIDNYEGRPMTLELLEQRSKLQRANEERG